MPYPPVDIVAVALETRVNLLASLSTSVSVSAPVATEVPEVPLARPPASIKLPVIAPLITAASFVPLIVTITKPLPVPSIELIAKVSPIFSPDLRLSNELLAVYVQSPELLIVKAPFTPDIE